MVMLFAVPNTQSAFKDLLSDPASVFVLVLSFALIGAVLWAGKSPAGPESPEDTGGSDSATSQE